MTIRRLLIAIAWLSAIGFAGVAFASELPSVPTAPVSQFINSLQQISVPTVHLPAIPTGNTIPTNMGSGFFAGIIDGISHLTLGQVFVFLKGIAMSAINIIASIIPRLVDFISSLFKLK